MDVEDKTTITDNEVIAEFIGFEIVSENPVIKGIVCHGRTWKAPVEKDLPYWGGFRAEQLHKFESSWLWLMPVWYKFRDLDSYSLELAEYSTYRYYWNTIANDIPRKPIADVCKLLAEGIRWYNSTQNKEQS